MLAYDPLMARSRPSNDDRYFLWISFRCRRAGEYIKSRCCALVLLRCCFVAASISSIHRIAAAGVCECLKPQEAERALLSPSYSYYDRRVPLLAITIMSITSDEVNYLIYRYLQESTHARMEAISHVECLRLIARGWM